MFKNSFFIKIKIILLIIIFIYFNYFNYLIINNKINRQKALRKFKEEEDVPVILISLKAGACGLNLTEAEVVFILDPWWNPQIEQQAIDRVYRIGQTKPVTVYKFIVKDSIEERLLSIQEKKLKISNIVLGDNQTARTLTKDDLISLFE